MLSMVHWEIEYRELGYETHIWKLSVIKAVFFYLRTEISYSLNYTYHETVCIRYFHNFYTFSQEKCPFAGQNEKYCFFLKKNIETLEYFHDMYSGKWSVI